MTQAVLDLRKLYETIDKEKLRARAVEEHFPTELLPLACWSHGMERRVTFEGMVGQPACAKRGG